MTDRSPERQLAHLRYQLAAERAAGAQRDADLARLRAEVARLAIAAGERPAPPPIVRLEPPAQPAPAAPPRRDPRNKGIRVRGGWLAAFLVGRTPMTATEVARATGRNPDTVRHTIWLMRDRLVATPTGNGNELAYALAAPLAAAG